MLTKLMIAPGLGLDRQDDFDLGLDQEDLEGLGQDVLEELGWAGVGLDLDFGNFGRKRISAGLPATELPVDPAPVGLSTSISGNTVGPVPLGLPARSSTAVWNVPYRGTQLGFFKPEDGMCFTSIKGMSLAVPGVTLRGDTLRLKSKGEFTQYQRMVYNALRYLYKQFYIRDRPYDVSDPDEAFMFNEDTWQVLICHLAQSVDNKPRDAGDCWYSGAKCDADGYPRFHVRPGGVSDMGSGRGGGLRFHTESGRDRVVKAAKLAEILGHPLRAIGRRLGDRQLQTDHRCENIKCFNPWHLSVANSLENKSRFYCRYGARVMCPHAINCLFCDPSTGLALLCINSPSGATPAMCRCQPGCFDVDRIRVRGPRAGLPRKAGKKVEAEISPEGEE